MYYRIHKTLANLWSQSNPVNVSLHSPFEYYLRIYFVVPTGVLSVNFPIKKLCEFLNSPTRATCLDLVTIFDLFAKMGLLLIEKYKLGNFSVRKFLCRSATFSFMVHKFFSKSLSLYTLLL